MKRMKNIIIATIGLFMMTSCGDWLSVTPKTEMSKKEMLTSQKGFESALIGTYIELKSANAYGFHMTMGVVENLASRWDVTKNTMEEQIGMHNYADEKSEAKIADIYGKLYNVIVNANAILEEIDNKKNMFESEFYYRIIKGEALTLRAICHLDILRLFGPVPSLADGSNILAYVKGMSIDPNFHISYAEYCKLLLADLAEAEELLKIDPIINYKAPTPSEEGLVDDFIKHREYRMNYYTTKALQARLHLYMGNHSQAYVAAKEVVEAKKADDTNLFKLGSGSNVTSNDLTFSSEHISTIYDFKLYKTYDTKFASGTVRKGTSASYVKTIFDQASTDIRVLLWGITTVNSTNYYVINKYRAYEKNSLGSICNLIPLLRLSEMYLILIETAPLSEAQEYYYTYRSSRSVSTPTLTEAGKAKSILAEYRREFYAEGQLFYTHKRMNSPLADITWFPRGAKVNYVLPLPKSELIEIK